MTRRRKGFTLIELLVVIAIIAILAAILFPVFMKAKEHANQTTCCGNMSQLWKAFRMYVDDYGRMPFVRVHGAPYFPNWCGSTTFGGGPLPVLSKGSLWRYVRGPGTYLCPSDKNVPALWFGGVRNYPCSYSVNNTLCASKIDSIPSPMARKGVMFLHESRETINDGDFNIGVDKIANVHYDGTTVMYLDGHAKWRKTTQLDAERWLGDWTFPANLQLDCH